MKNAFFMVRVYVLTVAGLFRWGGTRSPTCQRDQGTGGGPGEHNAPQNYMPPGTPVRPAAADI